MQCGERGSAVIPWLFWSSLGLLAFAVLLDAFIDDLL
jgi:hypothetical protein